MKYNRENIGGTLSKMRKMHPELTEYKEESSKSKYFYDFSLLENIPEEIREEVKETIIKNTSYTFGDWFHGSFSGEYQYYIDVELQRYSIYNLQGKRIYKIMEVLGVRVISYKWNIYGCTDDNALPEFVEEYGQIRESTWSNICDIEIA